MFNDTKLNGGLLMYRVLIIGNKAIGQSVGWTIDFADTYVPNSNFGNYDFIIFSNYYPELIADITHLRCNIKYLKPIGSLNFTSNYVNFTYSVDLRFIPLIDETLKRYNNIGNLSCNGKFHMLLKYLYLYPKNSLTPIMGLNGNYYASYVVETIFQIEPKIIEEVLKDLSDLNLIASKRFEFSSFCCSTCRCEIIKFNEICPNCNSTNIVNSKFIHCFKCGYVGTELNFLHNHELKCPNCSKVLQLIGDDYDHPLESGLCQTCGEIFVDSETTATCMSCNVLYSNVTLLSKNYYYHYELKENQEQRFISYIKGESFYLFDKINYISKEHFTYMLNWMLMLYKRHNDEHFNIVRLSFNNKAEELNFRELAEKFKGFLRNTDLYCTVGASAVLVLFPKSKEEDKIILKDRINTVINECVDGMIGYIKTTCYTAKDLSQSDVSKLWQLENDNV